MSAPLVVNTRDGACWTRRTVTEGGIALYALADVCRCPEFVMVMLAELAERGIVGSADVLPVPAPPEPEALSAERLAEIRSLDLLSMMSDRVAPVISGHLAALLAEIGRLEAQRDRRRVRLVDLQNDALNVRGALSPNGEDRKVPFPLGETLLPAVEWLIARVAELENERHETNEALDDAVRELRARQSCPCAPVDQPGPHQVGCPQAEVPSVPSERPVNGLTAVFAPVASLREVSSREEPHDSPLHQSHRVPHDLPVPDGCRLSADDLDEISRDAWFGGGS